MVNLSRLDPDSYCPLRVLIKRGNIIESIHRAHVAVCDIKGRLLMKAGYADYQTFIRSSLKPFQILPYLKAINSHEANNKAIAIACGSHDGKIMHAREVFKMLWNARIETEDLKCPVPKNKKSKLQHNCSGKHAAFLSACKEMDWPLGNYLEIDHPLQKKIFEILSELLGIPREELVGEKDNCGAPTLLLTLTQMALLYANLSNSNNAEFQKISTAMIENPELVAGEGLFDTELIKRSHGQVLSKGGSEGIQCIGRLGEGLGLAIKVEDGSKRAKHAVAIHLLRQLEWMTPTALDELFEKSFNLRPFVSVEVEGELKIT